MPLGKTGLKVTTIVGNKSFDAEDHRSEFYHRNQQHEKCVPKLEPLGKDIKPFGHPDKPKSKPESASEVKEIKPDEKLQVAIDNDLANRGVKKTRKRKSTNTEAK